MEWTVVTVIIALVGFVATFVGAAIKFTTIVIRLDCSVKQFSETAKDLTFKNTESHARIWEHNKSQDEKIEDHAQIINNHETRLSIIENKKGGQK